MEVDKVVTVRFFLAWCLLATTAIALASCRGAGASPEAGNATVARRCHGGECLIAYRQPEVELMAVLDAEHALGSILAADKPGDVTDAAQIQDNVACSRGTRDHRYTPCTPPANSKPHPNPYPR